MWPILFDEKDGAMKYLIGTSLVLATLVPAHADPAQNIYENVVVATPNRSLQAWQGTVSRELSANLRYPRPLGLASNDSDFVTVRFRCGDDGQPVDLTIAHKSRHGQFNGAAMRAVSRLGSLHPLPAGVALGQTFQANLVFAVDKESLDHQFARLRQSEAARMASSGAERQVIALNLTARSPG
ncbi:MAG: TonB family protein [Novosphingobium sp.]